ncbi:MAG: ankyrin repeat domain-containing protein [Longimicrobiales bacterium]
MRRLVLPTLILAACSTADADPRPSLAEALTQGNVEALEGLDLNEAQVDTALVRGASQSPLPAIRYLLDRGADPDFAVDDFGTTALMSAAGADRAETVALLVDAGADVDRTDSMGDPALNWAAYMGASEAVAVLLARGATPSVRSVHGDALGIALRRGHRAIVDRLVAVGVVDHPSPSPEQQAWIDAVASGSDAALDAPRAGMDMSFVTAAGTPALVEAAAFGRTDVVRALVVDAAADIEARDHAGFTALAVAARGGHDGTVRLLIDLGADVDATSDPLGMSMTPLMLAGAWGRTSALEMLLDAGADMEAPNAMGYPALLWTISAGQEEAARVLVERGADVHAEVDGYTALRLAELLEMPGLVGVMSETGGS